MRNVPQRAVLGGSATPPRWAGFLSIGLAMGLALASSSCGGDGGGGGSPTEPGPVPAEIRTSFQLSRNEVQNAVLPGQGEDFLKSVVSVHVDAPDTLLRHATLYVTGYLPDQVPSPLRWERHLQAGIDATGNGQLELESSLLRESTRPGDQRVVTRWDALVDLADTNIERVGAFELTFLRPVVRVDLSYQYEKGFGSPTLRFSASGPFDFAPGEEIPEPRDWYQRCGKIVRTYETPNSQLVGGTTIPGCLGAPVYSLVDSPSGPTLRTLTAVQVYLDDIRRHLEVENCPENLPCSTFEIDRLDCPLPGAADGVENFELTLPLSGPLDFDWAYDGLFLGVPASAVLSVHAQVSY